jgi:hypothetical protein
MGQVERFRFGVWLHVVFGCWGVLSHLDAEKAL